MADVVDYLGVSRKFVMTEVASGNLNAAKIAGGWRFRQVDVDSYIEARLTHADSSRG
jgi:excisionase family DNA binding protein